uniref:Uncharacterized protein n=1 Tax=Arundo donax TaxID=35708 RepID=A0A0A9FKG8_ARUDO
MKWSGFPQWQSKHKQRSY